MSRAKSKPPEPPSASEAEVTEAVLQAAQMLGIELKRRNVGSFQNPRGQTVRCAEAGDGDFYATLKDGRHLDLEIKREKFDPRKISGQQKEHFEEQLAKLRRTNDQGGVGIWVRSGVDFLQAMQRILSGWRAEIDEDGFCWVTDEPRGAGNASDVQDGPP